MCAALEHRGPRLARDPPRRRASALGIQRLRVIDLDTGDQPIYNEDRSVAVVLNGEIYNYRELRAELARRGHRFATQGDTEVIVHLYEEHGADCVRHLHGMFAFALWDARRRQLAARPRPGRQEAAALLRCATASSASPPSWGRCSATTRSRARSTTRRSTRYLALGYVPAPLSALRGVRKLPPAHTLDPARRRGRTLERYWRLDYSHKLDGVPDRGALRADPRRAAAQRPGAG